VLLNSNYNNNHQTKSSDTNRALQQLRDDHKLCNNNNNTNPIFFAWPFFQSCCVLLTLERSAENLFVNQSFGFCIFLFLTHLGSHELRLNAELPESASLPAFPPP